MDVYQPHSRHRSGYLRSPDTMQSQSSVPLMACHLWEKKDISDGNDRWYMPFLYEKWQVWTISRANVAGIQKTKTFWRGMLDINCWTWTRLGRKGRTWTSKEVWVEGTCYAEWKWRAFNVISLDSVEQTSALENQRISAIWSPQHLNHKLFKKSPADKASLDFGMLHNEDTLL